MDLTRTHNSHHQISLDQSQARAFERASVVLRGQITKVNKLQLFEFAIEPGKRLVGGSFILWKIIVIDQLFEDAAQAERHFVVVRTFVPVVPDIRSVSKLR